VGGVLLLGRSVVYVLVLSLAWLAVSWGVTAVAERGEPQSWGTFTTERTETTTGRNGTERRTVHGRWVSNDGALVLPDVQLVDATEDTAEIVPAYARPTTVLDDEVVHQVPPGWFSFVVPFLVAALFLGWTVERAWAWGDVAALASVRRHRRPPLDEPPLRSRPRTP